MIRILQNTPGTISQPWYEDGTLVDPGAVTVTITRADGTDLYTDQAASGTGAAVRTFDLTATDTALLDTLTATWVSSTKGTLTLQVEVVGGFLFTVAEARTIKPLDSTSVYPTARITEMRTLVEEAMEDAANVAFVPRYTQETFGGTGTTTALLKWPKVTAIRSATVDDIDVTPLSAVVALREGIGYLSTGWTGGYGNVTIAYEHGWARPPERIRRAALMEARYRLIQANQPTDDRAVRQDFDQGSYALHVPGRAGATFMLPETDAAVAQYSMAVGVA